MPSEFQATGGAILGSLQIPWPFAKLTSTENELRLRVRFFGSYAFTPRQVSALAPRHGLPMVSSGMQIEHNRSDVPARIAFLPAGGADPVLARIRAAGFQPVGKAAVGGAKEGRAVRAPVLIGAAVLWNALIIGDFFSSGRFIPVPGKLSLVAVGLAVLAAVALLRNSSAQRFALEPGRHIGELRPFLRLLIAIASFLFAMLAFFVALRNVAGLTVPPP